MFHFNPGHERDYDYYLDVGEYLPGPELWRAEDHYLDLEVRVGVRAGLADVADLLDAVRHGLLTPEAAEQAVHHAVDAVAGLAEHDYDLHGWLASNGMELTWR